MLISHVLYYTTFAHWFGWVNWGWEYFFPTNNLWGFMGIEDTSQLDVSQYWHACHIVKVFELNIYSLGLKIPMFVYYSTKQGMYKGL